MDINDIKDIWDSNIDTTSKILNEQQLKLILAEKIQQEKLITKKRFKRRLTAISVMLFYTLRSISFFMAGKWN